MHTDKSSFYGKEIAAYSLNISNVLIIAGMYWLVDNIGPTGKLFIHDESELKNDLAIPTLDVLNSRCAILC